MSDRRLVTASAVVVADIEVSEAGDVNSAYLRIGGKVSAVDILRVPGGYSGSPVCAIASASRSVATDGPEPGRRLPATSGVNHTVIAPTTPAPIRR